MVSLSAVISNQKIKNWDKLEPVIALHAQDMTGASLLRFCRLVRLVRVVKVFRVKYMKDTVCDAVHWKVNL